MHNLDEDITKMHMLYRNELNDRIKNLEKSREANSKINKEIFDRLDKLEKTVALENPIKADTKTYKCPVCEGYGRVHTGAAKVDFDGIRIAMLAKIEELFGANTEALCGINATSN